MKKGLIALSPLGVFIAFYLVTSIIAGDFYKIPITVAFMVSSIFAIIIFGDKPLMSRVNTYSRGAATEQMMLMIWILCWQVPLPVQLRRWVVSMPPSI